MEVSVSTMLSYTSFLQLSPHAWKSIECCCFFIYWCTKQKKSKDEQKTAFWLLNSHSFLHIFVTLFIFFFPHRPPSISHLFLPSPPPPLLSLPPLLCSLWVHFPSGTNAGAALPSMWHKVEQEQRRFIYTVPHVYSATCGTTLSRPQWRVAVLCTCAFVFSGHIIAAEKLRMSLSQLYVLGCSRNTFESICVQGVFTNLHLLFRMLVHILLNISQVTEV